MILVVAVALAIGIGAEAIAQSRQAPRAADPKEASLRMGETAIRGERELPDIFFIVPGGPSGDASSPHLRDYSFEILKPVVKPWLERDESIGALVAERDGGSTLSPAPDLPAPARRPAGPPPQRRPPRREAAPAPAREPTFVPAPRQRPTPRPRDSVPILIPEER